MDTQEIKTARALDLKWGSSNLKLSAHVPAGTKVTAHEDITGHMLYAVDLTGLLVEIHGTANRSLLDAMWVGCLAPDDAVSDWCSEWGAPGERI